MLTYFLGKIALEEINPFGQMGIAVTYLLVIFLFGMVLYQMFGEIADYYEDIKNLSLESLINIAKRINYVMLILALLLTAFILYFSLEFFVIYPKQIGIAVELIIVTLIGTIFEILILFIPIIFGKFILSRADKEEDIRTKFTWYLMPGILMGLAVPLIAYLIRNKWEDVLLFPVFVITIIGWLILLDYPILKFRRWLKERKK